MELKLYIKQAEQFNLQGQLVYYSGTNPQSLLVNMGTLPAPRQWPNYGSYVNITDSAGDLYKLKLAWSKEHDSNGGLSTGGNEQKKSVSGTISFEGDAYRYLKQWLIDDISAPLNSVDVKIEHTGCGSYENYTIKATDIEWCENAICNFDISLKQKDEPLSCIKRTLITDNWQGWFQDRPANGKKHPRFSYCNEIRPNGFMVAMWWLLAVSSFMVGVVLEVMAVVLLIIIGVLFLVATIINGIISAINFLGANIPLLPTAQMQQAMDELAKAATGGLIDFFANFFTESAGCGREHPAPLIRDYISNVCSKCGVFVDENTAPIFFAQNITVQTSDPSRGNNGTINTSNPHYNACYFFAQTERGIRRFSQVNLAGLTPNQTDYYIPGNGPILALDQFLDELKTVYNAAWAIRTVNKGGQLVPALYFQRKDWFTQTGQYLYDFSKKGADRPKIVEGICYEWNGNKIPASCTGLYAADGVDTCGNEARSHANGIISFGLTVNNPNQEGMLDKSVQYGAAKFRLDGASTDYIFDAIQAIMDTIVIDLVLAPVFGNIVYKFIKDYADYALLLKDETATLPKILIWDTGTGYENAKCVRNYYAHHNAGQEPDINMKYNDGINGNKIPAAWSDRHKPRVKVSGNGIGPQSDSRYIVNVPLFSNLIDQPAMLVNYPMYFEPGYRDTLWDWFHWIDDPVANPVLNMDWKLKIELCCDDLQKLKVFNDASNIRLGDMVKLSTPYYQDGKITEIELSYDPGDRLGQYIQLKGTV